MIGILTKNIFLSQVFASNGLLSHKSNHILSSVFSIQRLQGKSAIRPLLTGQSHISLVYIKHYVVWLTDMGLRPVLAHCLLLTTCSLTRCTGYYHYLCTWGIFTSEKEDDLFLHAKVHEADFKHAHFTNGWYHIVLLVLDTDRILLLLPLCNQRET